MASPRVSFPRTCLLWDLGEGSLSPSGKPLAPWCLITIACSRKEMATVPASKEAALSKEGRPQTSLGGGQGLSAWALSSIAVGRAGGMESKWLVT